MESIDIKTITEAGAVGIAVLLVLYSAWKDRIYNKTLGNHLDHVTTAITALDKTTQAQQFCTTNVTKAIENNTRILERIERVLDKK